MAGIVERRIMRDLGIVEEAMHVLGTRRGTGHLVREVVIEGPCDANVLRRAFSALQRRFAVLRVGICDGGSEPPRFIDVDQPVQIAALPGGPADQIIEADLNRPLGDETVRAAIRTESASRLRMILSVNHAVIDGRWLNQLCRNLVELCEREARKEIKGRLPEVPLGPPLDQLLPFAPVQVDREAFKAFSERQAALLEADPPRPIPAFSNAAKVESRFISGSLILTEHRRGLHVVAALGAALLRQARRLIPAVGPVPLAFAATADVGARLRRPPMTPGVYLSGVRTVLRLDPSHDEIKGISTSLYDKLRRSLARGDAELGVLAQRAAVDYHLATGDAPAAVTVSYLGNVPSPETFLVRLSSLRGAVPMHGFGPSFYCHASRMGNHLSCHLVFPDPLIRPTDAEAAFVTALEDAASVLGASVQHEDQRGRL